MGGITSIYIPKERMQMFERFKEWCEDHGKPWSEALLDLVEKSDVTKDFPESNNHTERWKICEHSAKMDGKLIKGEFMCLRDQLWHIPIACDRCHFFMRIKEETKK